MLITFTSKAAAEVVMYKEHAKRILDLLGKDASRGVITAAEAPNAVDILEKEIAETRKHQASDDMQRDVNAHHSASGDDTDHEGAQLVSFSTRAYPLLEMLRAAKAGGYDVLWGV
jgi:predicted metalloendopeptidase